MAYTVQTLQNQVNSISTLSSASTSIDSWLIDGVKDVIHKISKLDPLKLELFSTTETFDKDGHHVPSGIIINVQRSTGSFIGQSNIEDFRSASKIPKTMVERVLDEDGFFFRSKYNPVYYIEDSTVFVLPIPITGVEDDPMTPADDESIPEENGRVTFVKIPTEGKASLDDASWNPLESATHCYIRYVPDRYTYPVVLYAANRAIDRRMRELGHGEEDVEMLQAMQALSVQIANEYNSYLMLGAAQPNPAQTQAPQRDEGEARR